jgi:PBCV-specific basic adaptor domain
MVMDEYVAEIPFVDGEWREVYVGADGRQYVIDGDGQKVYGVWFFPRGEPVPNVIINAAAHP